MRRDREEPVFRGAPRPVGDQTNDWCFNCHACGKYVRADGYAWPKGMTKTSITIEIKGEPTVIPKLCCSPSCAVEPGHGQAKEAEEAEAEEGADAAEEAA